MTGMRERRRAGPLHEAAWPHMLDSLQAAYAELTQAQWQLERRADELNGARELFEQVVESMSEGLLLVDKRGRLGRVNRAACELLGASREALVGRQLTDVWPGDPVPSTPWELFELSDRARAATLDRELRLPSSGPLIAQIACSLVRDERGRINGLLVIARDVTASRREEAAQRLLADVSGHLGASVNYARVLRRIVERLVAGEYGWCALYERTGAALHLLASTGAAPPIPAVLRGREAADSPLEDALRHRRATLAPADGRGGRAPWLVVPLAVGRRNLGSLAVGHRSRPRFDAFDLRVHAEVGRRIALAIDNARLHNALDRARRAAEETAGMVARVQEITDVALVHLELPDLLDELVERIAHGVDADSACFLLPDLEDASLLVARAARGLDEREIEQLLERVGRHRRGSRYGRPLALDAPGGGARAIRRDHVGTRVAVPLRLRGRESGLLCIGTRQPRRFTETDLRLLSLVGERAALAIDNARVFERERGIAETLQRSLLPERLPRVPGIALAARYFPGAAGTEVGGDWYDVVPLSGDRLAVTVGDVVGRGVRAAAAMGQLRMALRTYLFEGLGPSEALERLNRISTELQDGTFATVLCLLLEPASGRVRVASAGHPPPIALEPGGRARPLDAALSIPLGTHLPTAYRDSVHELELGATLLLYTDGLIERRGEPFDAGLQRLLAAADHGPPLIEELLDHVVEQLLGQSSGEDDTALLVLRRLPECSRLVLRLPSDTGVLADTRLRLRRWLTELGVSVREADDVVLATSEMCANAIEHPIEPRTDEFELTLASDGPTIELTVRDSGRWNERAVRPGRGFGLGIARAVMEAVEVDRDPSGTTIRMRRRLGTGRDPAQPRRPRG